MAAASVVSARSQLRVIPGGRSELTSVFGPRQRLLDQARQASVRPAPDPRARALAQALGIIIFLGSCLGGGAALGAVGQAVFTPQATQIEAEGR